MTDSQDRATPFGSNRGVLPSRIFRSLRRTALAAALGCVSLGFAAQQGPTVTASVAPPSAPPAVRSQEMDTSLGVKITKAQEEATERGLNWLARCQNEDGSWNAGIGYKLNNRYRTTKEDTGHVGVTALAGMAYLAGGHLPGRGKYGKVLDGAVDFVLKSTNGDGYITRGGTRMYTHAFATLFLAEVFGMTHREDTRVRLQKAIDFIVKSQNAEGGWRYGPQAQDSDMSIVVCQCLALRAARNIGIRVPKSTIDNAINYVVDSSVRDNLSRGGRYSSAGTFAYQVRARSRTTFPLTAAGVTALNGLGIYSDELIDRGIDFLNSEFDRFSQLYGVNGHYFFWYGHYYAVQALYTKGGHDWVNYFTRLRKFLLARQRADGSWLNSVGPGDAFSTAMACLILEIPYDFLPIFHR